MRRWHFAVKSYKDCDFNVRFCISEKYTRGVSAVESILTLDRLRQNVAVKELLQAQGQPLMRKTASVPNFSQVNQPSLCQTKPQSCIPLPCL